MHATLSAAALALASALVWGTGDFFGALAARRMAAARVTVLAQLAALLLLTALAVVSEQAIPQGRVLLCAASAGVMAGLGMLALYASMATGAIAVAAPVAALVTTFLPAVASFYLDGPPHLPQLAGFAVAFVSIWLVAGGGADRQSGPARRAFLLSLLAGLGFGVFQVLMRLAGPTAAEAALGVARLSSLPILVTAALVGPAFFRSGAPEGQGGAAASPAKWVLLFSVLAGLFDAGGTALFVAAARVGRLDVASVLSALYPVTTVVLAALLLKEHPSRAQRLGLLCSLCAVVLIGS